eukprot:TRINITY_DN5680_c0_g2_i1.p1 TRINITY_DN5680_c0_g2~~TRINITY_DN5680_c0_g2_i1.p1  ORF type:complete len:153 (-),score=19.33 TRINITY_DN5680_c0_g2_i1:411-869(-)
MQEYTTSSINIPFQAIFFEIQSPTEPVISLYYISTRNMSAYQHYRNTTLGTCLEEALDELMQSQNISTELSIKVFVQFDRAMNHLLKDKVRNKFAFKGSLHAYRYCDNVWTYVLKDAEFKPSVKDGSDGIIQVSKVKFVACEAIAPQGNQPI